MGGFGSGRWDRSRRTTSDMLAFDIRRLPSLDPGQTFFLRWSINGDDAGSISVRTEANRLVLTYHAENGPAQLPVPMTWTGCHFGGKRPWLLCPRCRTRVSILYGGASFACRHCHRLAYASQSDTKSARLRRQAERIRERLGWPPGIANANGEKPTRMHWRTYMLLRDQHDNLVSRVSADLLGRVETFKRSS